MKHYLISMVEFVLRYTQKSNTGYEAGFKALEGIKMFQNYANFLSQKLEIWMFVPCKFTGGVWVVLDNPKNKIYPASMSYATQILEDEKEYQEAKKLCLFEGFEIKEYSRKLLSVENKGISVFFKKPLTEWYVSIGILTIEDLVKYNLELSKTAIEKFEFLSIK